MLYIYVYVCLCDNSSVWERFPSSKPHLGQLMRPPWQFIHTYWRIHHFETLTPANFGSVLTRSATWFESLPRKPRRTGNWLGCPALCSWMVMAGKGESSSFFSILHSFIGFWCSKLCQVIFTHFNIFFTYVYLSHLCHARTDHGICTAAVPCCRRRPRTHVAQRGLSPDAAWQLWKSIKNEIFFKKKVY